MANETNKDAIESGGNEMIKATHDPLLIDEFEIIELEDRLEFAGRCNNCKPA